MRGNKKNKRIKNRLNILREIHLNKKRVKTVADSITSVTLEPFRDQGKKVYKTVDRNDRNADYWEAKIEKDNSFKPTNKNNWEALKNRCDFNETLNKMEG